MRFTLEATQTTFNHSSQSCATAMSHTDPVAQMFSNIIPYDSRSFSQQWEFANPRTRSSNASNLSPSTRVWTHVSSSPTERSVARLQAKQYGLTPNLCPQTDVYKSNSESEWINVQRMKLNYIHLYPLFKHSVCSVSVPSVKEMST